MYLQGGSQPTTSKEDFLASMDSMVASRPENIAVMKQRAQDEVFLLPGIALAGQLTIINASFSTGKTLLTMWLLANRDKAATKKFSFYYVNADDNFNGSITKAELMESHKVNTYLAYRFRPSHFD